MARPFRVFLLVAVVGALGVGAYVERDRLKGEYDRLTAQNSSAGAHGSAGQQAGQQSGQRRGGAGRRAFGQGQGPTPVLVSEAKAADVPVYVDGVGAVKALNTVTVRPQVNGKIVEIDFVEGQDIKKGDVIARIDDAVYKAQRDQAVAKKAQDEALLRNAQLDLERYERMVQTASGTQQQADTQRSLVAQYQAQVQSDQAAIESAQATLDYTTIEAPIDGRTGIRNVDVGNLVSSTDTTGIVTLSQIKPISVLFSIPQQQLGRINAASATGTLSVQALSGDGKVIDSGSLTVVDNQVDPTTGTVKLKANFPNDKLTLWPGAFVNARLLVETMKGVTVVPTASVQRGPNGTFVYLVQSDQTVSMKSVKVGLQDDVQAVIAEGVVPGDKVVTTGFARLQDGAKVEVSAPATEGTPNAQQPAADNNGQQPHRRHNGEQGGGNGEGGGHHRGNGGTAATSPDTTSAIPSAQPQ
jgi:multidrug efflux system membrane fusion protein